MADDTPPEDCTHFPKVGRGMCRRCYGRDYYRNKADYRDRLKDQKRKKYAEDPEYFLARSRAHYAVNSEEHIARRIEWRKANPEKQRDTSTAWRRANLERCAISSHRRRAREASAPGTFTVEEWHAILEEFDNRCAYCHTSTEPLVMEHMRPLVRGGSNDAKNIVPSCATCNSRKGTKDIFEFLPKQNVIRK